MATFRLSRDVEINFFGYPVTAKAGTAVMLIKGGSGTRGDLFAIPPGSCDAGRMGKAGTWSIFGHDSKYYHVWAPDDAVERVE